MQKDNKHSQAGTQLVLLLNTGHCDSNRYNFEPLQQRPAVSPALGCWDTPLQPKDACAGPFHKRAHKPFVEGLRCELYVAQLHKAWAIGVISGVAQHLCSISKGPWRKHCGGAPQLCYLLLQVEVFCKPQAVALCAHLHNEVHVACLSVEFWIHEEGRGERSATAATVLTAALQQVSNS